LHEALPYFILTEAQIFSKNQHRLLLPDDALHIGPSYSRKT